MTDLIHSSVGYSDGDIETNPSTGLSLEAIASERLSRRQTLFGGMGATAAAMFAPMALAGCEDNDGDSTNGLTVSAGEARSTSSGKAVSLTGSTSGGDTVSGMSWTQTSGPPVTLTGGTSMTASFIAPSVAAATPLTFRFNATTNGVTVPSADTTVTVAPSRIDFEAVPKNLNDIVTVPADYTATVLYRLGDPLTANTPAYANDGTDTNFAQRAGDHHDGMSYFGLAATGNAPAASSSTRGLLVMNHENITIRYLHPNGPTTVAGARPTVEVVKEIEAHGVSVVEVTRAGETGAWSYVQASPLNRRITPFTPTVINGPARGSTLLYTAFSNDGTRGRGTINNCANGYMPWGTYTTCEENWAGYFRREAGDNARRAAALGARAVTAFQRYGLNTPTTAGVADSLRPGNYNWATAAPTAAGNTDIAKFNATTVASAPIDGTGDFRNEPNQYGWVVEIDPYDPASVPRKRTALGRMNHEGAWPSNMVAGRRPAFYMGDDAQNEYLYKFVSAEAWVGADATATDRLATGDKYLDRGTLYVARFNPDGTGSWLPLVFGQGPLTAANPAYAFVDQADVLVHTRLAADALGATRMDRPEWTAVNPVTGEMYLTLTNNSSRAVTNVDAANPRSYVDNKLPQGDQGSVDPVSPPQRTLGNANGHIIRLRETGGNSEATTFNWDIYAFGAGADLSASNINLSGLDATNDFSSPDGLWFSRPTNAGGLVTPLLWVQTDDGAYTDVTNCMMLLGMPGVVGDGGARTITNTNAAGATSTATTIVGRAPGANLRRFLVGPKECEVTGVDTTPDGRTVFINIQHPGEDTQTGFPNSFPSNWPASQTNPTAVSRPRSATVAITKNDGGVIGL